MNAPADERQQQELQEERECRSLEALFRVAKGMSDLADAQFLASELGLTFRYEQEPTMKISQMKDSKYLSKGDIDGEVIVTISKIGQGNVALEDQPEELKWMIKFREFPKPMVLNSTNIQLLAKVCGSDETDDWIGKECVLYIDENVSYGGQLVGGIRVKSAAPVAAPKRAAMRGNFKDIESDIPF